MGDSYPQPDTRNRYQGRGSGDRIARLKQIATREGPPPTNQNSESWLLTKQQGCCCIQEVCFIPGYDIPWPLVDGYYEITGILDDTTIIFNVAQMTTDCTETEGCNPSIGFWDGNIYPTNVTELITKSIVCNVPISLQMPVDSYSTPIFTENIEFTAGYSPKICPGGEGVPITIKLKLIYTGRTDAVFRALAEAARAQNAAANAVNTAVVAATSSSQNLSLIQAAALAATQAAQAAQAAAAAAQAATTATAAIAQADIAEAQADIAVTQAQLAASLLNP